MGVPAVNERRNRHRLLAKWITGTTMAVMLLAMAVPAQADDLEDLANSHLRLLADATSACVGYGVND